MFGKCLTGTEEEQMNGLESQLTQLEVWGKALYRTKPSSLIPASAGTGDRLVRNIYSYL